MAVDGCGLVCKYFLLIFNIIFAVLGIAFFSLGMWLRFSNDTRGIFEFESLNSSAFVIAVTVLIVLGSVMLIVSLFGDYGACNEKICALQVFITLLGILTVAEVVVGVLVYSKKDEIGARAAEFYMTMYTLYAARGDPIIGATLTFTNNLLHCCGVSGSKLLESICPRPDSFMEHFIMPNCPVTIVTVFDSKASLVMGIFIGTGALLMVALICAIVLLKEVKRSYGNMAAYYSNVY